MVKGTLSRLQDAKSHLLITRSLKFLEANHTDKVPILDMYMYYAAREMLCIHICMKRHPHTILIFRYSTCILCWQV